MLGTDGELSTEVSGWCRRLGRESSVLTSSSDRQLLGELAFEGPVHIAADASATRSLHTAKLRIGSALVDPDKTIASEHEEEAIVFGMKTGATLYVGLQTYGGSLQGEILIRLLPSEFDLLWEQSASHPSVYVKGELLGVGYSRPMALADDHASARIRVLQLRVADEFAVSSSWLELRRTMDFEDAWDLDHFGDSNYGQVRRIVKEFAGSAASSCLAMPERDSVVMHVKELLREARRTFRNPLSLTGEAFANVWNLSRAEFEKLLTARDSTEVDKLKGQFDQLWQHVSVLQVLTAGEAKASAEAAGHRAAVEELETLAEELLSKPSVNSPTLEWALLDALVYAECIAFAKLVIPGKRMFGVPIQAPIPGLQPFKTLGKSVVSTVMSVIGETIKVFATFAVAYLLAQENVQTAWVITTGATAARWVRLAVLWREMHPRVRLAELLDKMAAVSELFKTTHFNAQAARDQLRRVTYDGAVFSPWVANILDARIRREQ